MQTSDDRDHLDDLRAREFMSNLQRRAHQMVSSGKSQITAGKPGEVIIEEWQSHGVHVRHLPDDEQGILRISVGGGETPVPLNYLVFRGAHGKCVQLLRNALLALEDPDGLRGESNAHSH